ncbi:hypothetical protein [Brevundimonas sp. Root1279]|uniref:hypothetical protein n=1 Tax=Brevundimonas sp. Root1279 TaxID=1736443 RepID=UPI000700A52E|nr:hypothetical protein [Brevundimonas sp. Root1279]KQW83746.1 hypothetical protein ASC65_03590 [Brevundimonas sp. Root1279]
MKRLEPNLLLAISTGFALVLAVMTTVLFGPPEAMLRNPLMAIICAGGFILLNPRLARMMGQPPRPPMINRDTPTSAVWATLFPLIIILLAAIPVFWPGHDYGLIVIIAAVIFGLTAESALKARGGF